MKFLRTLWLCVAAMSILMTGCSSPGSIGKGIYNDVLKMYENNEIKNKLTKKYFWDKSKNFTEVNFFFLDPETKKEHLYYLYICKNTGSQKEAIEKAQDQVKYYKSYNRNNETYSKDTIVISIPKKTTKNLDVKVYELFMSVVK
mgnify:CR=1 FL=1